MIVDASGFVGAVREGVLHKIPEPKTIGLIRYELGNVLWKAARFQQREGVLETYERWLQAVDLFEMVEIDFKETLKTAIKEGMSFYDAAYLLAAKNVDEPILTLDRDFEGKWRVVHPTDL